MKVAEYCDDCSGAGQVEKLVGVPRQLPHTWLQGWMKAGVRGGAPRAGRPPVAAERKAKESAKKGDGCGVIGAGAACGSADVAVGRHADRGTDPGRTITRAPCAGFSEKWARVAISRPAVQSSRTPRLCRSGPGRAGPD